MKIEKDLYAYLWQNPYENNCNTYLIHGEITVLIDPGHSRHVPHLFHQMEGDGISPEEINLVILTHCHPIHLCVQVPPRHEVQGKALRARRGQEAAQERSRNRRAAQGDGGAANHVAMIIGAETAVLRADLERPVVVIVRREILDLRRAVAEPPAEDIVSHSAAQPEFSQNIPS